MVRRSFFLVLCVVLSTFFCACSSGTSDSPAGAAGGGSGGSASASCPSLSGDWTVTQHCDASLIGSTAVVTQTACALAFAPPFDAFTGSVTAAGQVMLSGPQTCSGTSGTSAITLNCTPGTCAVTLSK